MIDLHIHTNHSDGTDSVEEVLQKAENKKIEIISITDHDTVEAYFELEKNPNLRKKFSGTIITGAEIKTTFDNISIEVLAYGFDYNKIKIKKIDYIKLQNKELQKLKNVLQQKGFKYNENNLYIDASDPKHHWAGMTVAREILSHPENNKLIKEIGEFTVDSFFRIHQCNKNSMFYINEDTNTLKLTEIINRVHEAGGLVFLAHPYIYPFENKEKEIEKIISTTSIDGLECEYPLFSPKEREELKKIAKKYNKYMCGGTDYHAKNKPNIELGTGINNNINISQNIVNNWINKVKKV